MGLPNSVSGEHSGGRTVAVVQKATAATQRLNAVLSELPATATAADLFARISTLREDLSAAAARETALEQSLDAVLRDRSDMATTNQNLFLSLKQCEEQLHLMAGQ
jgi:hypothetical protein